MRKFWLFFLHMFSGFAAGAPDLPLQPMKLDADLTPPPDYLNGDPDKIRKID
ncbi:MAG: hypothetical protein PSY14_15440 [bacterium]|nr:hypothetical protein [bacterium]